MSSLVPDLPPNEDKDFRDLLKEVSQTSGDSQAEAYSKHFPTVDWLVEMLKQPDYKTRFWAVSTIRAIAAFVNQNVNQVTLRSRLLEDNRVGELVDSARIPFRPPELFQPLVQLLRSDPVEGIRLEAVKTLGVMAYPGSFSQLIQALSDQSMVVREAIILSIELLKPTEEVLPALFEFLKDQKVELSRASIIILGNLGYPYAVEVLIEALNDPKAEVRYRSALALGKTRDKRAYEPLLAAMGDEDRLVREAATAGLGKLGEKRAVEPLLTALNDPDYLVTQAAARSLGELGDLRAVEPLIAAVEAGNRNIYQAAEL